MEQVLAIDLSVEPAQAILASISGNRVEILQQHQFSLSKDFAIESLLDESCFLSNGHESDGIVIDQNGTGENREVKISPIDANTITGLADALEEFPRTWTNSVVVIPMLEYLSLNVTLPFADAKNINKIIDLEVQDIVPFEVDEFLIEGHLVHSLSETQHDIHVSLAPKRYIKNLITLCRASGLEPSIITTPCGSLAALPLAAPDFFQDSYAIIAVTPHITYFCCAIDGVVRADKAIPFLIQSKSDLVPLITELKLAILSQENKHNKKFSKVFVQAPTRIVTDLQYSLGRPVESLELSEFVTSASNDDQKKVAARGALATLFAVGDKPALPLTNFRVREFSFRPNWGALITSILSIKHYFLLLIAAIIVALFGSYQLRELQISRLRSALREQIKTVMPDISGSEETIIPSFIGRLSTLSKELESLGSSHEISPMNILVELTKDLGDQKDVTINEIDIRPDRVLLDISVPDYSAADRVERILRRKKDLYRRIRKDASSYASASGGRNFNFELKLVD